jgi:hypothetical protein
MRFYNLELKHRTFSCSSATLLASSASTCLTSSSIMVNLRLSTLVKWSEACFSEFLRCRNWWSSTGRPIPQIDIDQLWLWYIPILARKSLIQRKKMIEESCWLLFISMNLFLQKIEKKSPQSTMINKFPNEYYAAACQHTSRPSRLPV